MIKGRGCREDVEGKGDGQAMVVRCCPALALSVIALSALASCVITSALHVLWKGRGMIKERTKMWKVREMIKERECREGVEGKRDDKGKGV